MRPRHGFTLIEILVVVTIITTLIGLSLASVTVLRRQGQRQKTAAILAIARNALTVSALDIGGLIAPGEHPLAGSDATAAPRRPFVRADGTALTASGEALVGVDPTDVPAAAGGRVLLDADRFADPSAPLLYGAARGDLGILAAPVRGITRYVRLPRPPAGTRHDAARLAQLEADPRHLVQPVESDVASGSKRVLDLVLNQANAGSELSRLGALQAPPDDAALIVDGRLWGDGQLSARWTAGTVRDAGRWHGYRLRGLALYDAWGREVFYAATNGTAVLLSAGADGVLQVHPGEDGEIATPATLDAIADGDVDGSHDNIVVGRN